LYKLADLMERDQQFLAELESLNGGKGVRIAREMDIADAIGCLRCVFRFLSTSTEREKVADGMGRDAQVLCWMGGKSDGRDD
jgi:acyl-CoA reductase-like NAD-dependent aldehyde dehydrogenase